MSDERNEHSAAELGEAPPAEAERANAPAEPVAAEETTSWRPPPEPSRPAEYPRRSRSWTPLWLAVLLIVVVAGVLSSPFWGAAVAPLLPWAEPSGAGKYDALAQRVAALEARPAAPAIDPDAIKATQAALAQKITMLEDRVAELRQSQQGATATKAALQQQAQRLDAAQAQSTTQAAELDKLRQELTQRSAAGGEIASRLDALEHQVHSQNGAEQNEGVRLLALLQMREAVEAGQPFPAAFAAFDRLASGDPELAAAARPLADAARDGVASRGELRRRLGELANHADTAKPPPVKSKWWAAALDRVRALVTIRRIDGAATTGLDAAVDAAQTALARGDLAGAIEALDGLSAAKPEAAQSWLKSARARLAAEAALAQLQALLTTRLGTPPGSPATNAPPPATVAPPAAPKTPS